MTDDTGDAPDRNIPESGPTGLDVARRALAAARAAASAKGMSVTRFPITRAPAPKWTDRISRRGDRRSGPGPDDRDPQELSGMIPRMLAERGWQTRAAVSGLLGNWDELVGPEVAAHSSPESFTEGRLTVRTDSTAWATQLRLLAPMLTEQLNERLRDVPGASAEAAVTKITVKGPEGPRWRKGAWSVPGRGPRDTYG